MTEKDINLNFGMFSKRLHYNVLLGFLTKGRQYSAQITLQTRKEKDVVCCQHVYNPLNPLSCSHIARSFHDSKEQ